MKNIPALLLWVAIVFFGALLAVDAMITEDEINAAKIERHLSELKR